MAKPAPQNAEAVLTAATHNRREGAGDRQGAADGPEMSLSLAVVSQSSGLPPRGSQIRRPVLLAQANVSGARATPPVAPRSPSSRFRPHHRSPRRWITRQVPADQPVARTGGYRLRSYGRR